MRGRLATAVRNVERARTASGRSDPEGALELWTGLVAGEWSLVDEWESDGRRYVAAYRNGPDVKDPRGLTLVERRVLRFASLASSNKDIAFTLGLSEGAVASAVSQLLRKLRCRRRSDLLAFADPASAAHVRLHVAGDEIGVLAVARALDDAALDRLSPAERAIAAALVEGKTNAAIARARGTSAHTVANQIRSIFERLGVGSRTELVRALTTG
jgi:DNA-binding NarL/FixJ family response regulator